MNDPTQPPIVELRRDRVLEQVARLEERVGTAAVEPQALELFGDAAFVANKANALIRALEGPSSRFFIPVSPEDTEVRAAVRRRSADTPDGSRISFDLFRDCVDRQIQRRIDMGVLLVERSSEDTPDTLSKKVARLRLHHDLPRGSDGGSDLWDLDLLLSQFLILLMTRHLTGLFDGEDHANFVAAIPDGEGAEVVIATQALVSISLQLLIFGINDEILSDWYDRSDLVRLPRGMRGRDVVAAARRLPRTPLHDLAEAQAGQGDYQRILRYAVSYVSRSPDPGFHLWVAYMETAEARADAQNMWSFAPSYSATHRAMAESEEPPPPRYGQRRSRGEDEDPAEEWWDRAVQIGIESVVPARQTYLREEQGRLGQISQQLDRIAQTLNMTFSSDAVCCMARFASQLSSEKRAYLRVAIEALKLLDAQSFAVDLEALLSRLFDVSFVAELMRRAIYEAQRFFDGVLHKLSGLFDDDIQQLLCCKPIEILVESVLRLAVAQEDRLVSLLEQLALDTRRHYVGGGRRFLLLGDLRYAQQLLDVLEAVDGLLDNQQICGQDLDIDELAPHLERLSRTIEPPPGVEIESGDREKYFGNTKWGETAYGWPLPPLGETVGRLEDFVGESVEDAERVAEEARDRLVGDGGQTAAAGRPSICYRAFTNQQARSAAENV